VKSRRPFPQQLPVEDDGLLTPEVKIWSKDKWAFVRSYADIFTKSMHDKWHTAYLDLFSAAGRAKISTGTGFQNFDSSPMLALNTAKPFDTYVFMDSDSALTSALRERVNRHALRERVSVLDGNFNNTSDIDRVIAIVKAAASRSSQSPLVFTLLDPFDLSLNFEGIRRIAENLRSDFLILLALEMDAQRNLDYYEPDESEKIEQLLGDPEWRRIWQLEPVRKPTDFIRFIVREFQGKMSALGYITSDPPPMVPIQNSIDRNIYHLAFFSRNPRGLEFWKKIQGSSNRQRSLF